MFYQIQLKQTIRNKSALAGRSELWGFAGGAHVFKNQEKCIVLQKYESTNTMSKNNYFYV